jgi:hypothetical protein
MTSEMLQDTIPTTKSVGFLYTRSEFAEKEIMKGIPFTIATKIKNKFNQASKSSVMK